MTFDIRKYEMPVIKSIPEMAFESMVEEIRRFQETLAGDMELGIVANGAGLTIHVESVRLSGHMIVFTGADVDAREACLIQHYTQINVQMIAVPKQQTEARRIGF